MKFTQTQVGYSLVKNFYEIGEKMRHDTDRKTQAAWLLQGHIKIHGEERVKQAARKANQKLRFKFYQI